MASPVKMTAASGGHLIYGEDAVLFSLFYQKETSDPTQVILGHWWVHVLPSVFFRGLLGPSPGLRGSRQTHKLGAGGPLEKSLEVEEMNPSEPQARAGPNGLSPLHTL